MKKNGTTSKVLWGIIFLILAVNLILLLEIKTKVNVGSPFEDLDINKPTLLVVMDEYECASCVAGLRILNGVHETLEADGRIAVRGIILSKDKRDRKSIASAFHFPVEISDDYDIMRRLKMNRTPLLIGITSNHRIIYSELVPFGTGITREYVENGIVDRLYYTTTLTEK